MAEHIFERELDRLFGEPPPFPDAELFTLRVDERLGRGWTARRLAIGGMGVIGGVVGGAQLLSAGVADRLGAATSQAGGIITGKVVDLVEDNMMPQSFPLTADIIWVASILAAVAVVYAVTRIMREF